ncbi:MalY/PatB family protein [Paenibacillus sp. NPDC058071]|uniref:MalY/PatB family protein n=1 Tax=Paenibacillus sp. NPDC058071 TaxID=3346326 RepID=UPI0036D7A31A
MTYNFDEIIDRRNTNSFKWDGNEQLYGDADLLPLWVADMDFKSPPAVIEALTKRALLGNYGYTLRPESYEQSIIGWFGRRHDWQIDPKTMLDMPGVVTTLSLSIAELTQPGDGVIIQSPIYPPFYTVVTDNDRKLFDVPLTIQNERYEMDYEGLEAAMKNGAKMILLCSPHNPVGRVWEREELLKLADLCVKYGVIVISDEIHCDIVLAGHKHIPFTTLSEEAAKLTVTAMAPSKTFNIPGLQASFVVIPNENLRKKFDAKRQVLSLNNLNYFHVDAVNAVYNEGEEWLDELLTYVEGNIDFAIDYLREHLPQAKTIRPDGTYLLWVDCRAFAPTKASVNELMLRKARVAFSEGSAFSPAAEGFLRMNLGCPRQTLEEALRKFCDAARA